MNLRAKTIKGLFWSGLQLWGGRGGSSLVFLILSRLLTPDIFGLVAMGSVYITFIDTFSDQGFGKAIIQRRYLTSEHLDTAFWTNLLIGGLLTLISLIFSYQIAFIFHEPRLTLIICWLSLDFIFVGLNSTQEAILQRELRFKELAKRTLIATSIGGIIGITMAFLGFGVWSLIAQNLTTGLLGVFVLWKVSKWRPGFRFSKKHFNELFSFGINIVGNDVLDFLNRHTDDILIGIYLGPVMLGFYTVAYKIITIMTALLTGVISAVAFPAFSLIQNDLDRMRRGFYQAIHYISLISFPAFIGVTLLAPELVTTVFGPQWLLSIPVMQILAFIGILHSVFIFNGDIILASGKPSWRLGLTLMNAITNVIAFALVVQWGIVAVAAVYVIRGYLVSPINLYVVKRLIGIEFKTYFNQFKEALVSTVAMAIALIGLKQFDIINGLRPYLQLIIYTFFGACVYLLIIQAMVPNFWGQLSGFATSVFPNLRPKKIGRES